MWMLLSLTICQVYRQCNVQLAVHSPVIGKESRLGNNVEMHKILNIPNASIQTSQSEVWQDVV